MSAWKDPAAGSTIIRLVAPFMGANPDMTFALRIVDEVAAEQDDPRPLLLHLAAMVSSAFSAMAGGDDELAQELLQEFALRTSGESPS